MLTLVQKEDNLVESLQKVHVIVAILLNLVEQGHFRARVRGEGREQWNILFDMAKSLVLKQIFLFVPLHTCHDTSPNLKF